MSRQKKQRTRKIINSVLKILSLLWQAVVIVLTEIQKQSKRALKWYLRRVLSPQRSQSQSGFLMPMVAVLLVVMGLVVGSLLLRSTNRTIQVTGDRVEQATYNAANPAIDRAKAKLEYLFIQDPRWPRGLPPDGFIESLVLNDGANGTVRLDYDETTPSTMDNPYDFPDETRLDINGDGTPDNAWTFNIDANGDGRMDKVAYSILMRTRRSSITRANLDVEKAPQLVMRNGPMNMKAVGNDACENISEEEFQGGWDIIDGATVRRAFQVTSVVVSNDEANRNVTTLEMQQDRQAVLGNRWGAWFRYDLEIFPGPPFRWNGAMHTEGNFIVESGNGFDAYLISSPSSCLYAKGNSEISIAGNADETIPINPDTGTRPFLGQAVLGSLRDNDNTSGAAVNFHIHQEGRAPTLGSASENVNMTNALDSVNGTSAVPADLALDAVELLTNGTSRSRVADTPVGATDISSRRDPNWKNRTLVTDGRIFNQSVTAPFVDDSYRADDRYGPKPRYTQLLDLGTNTTGQLITGRDNLTRLNEAEPENSGLDGYWERRAWAEGLRIIVGQRLELGNTFGWRGVNDPLNPPQQGVTCRTNRCHEQRQWRTLRDNLAAVQSTVVYHNERTSDGITVTAGRFPLACLASTAHPGTGRPVGTPAAADPGFGTIANSTTFNNITVGGTTRLNTDFLTGNGTNGWEFNVPGGNEAGFMTAISAGQPLRIALRNLANFAGDPFGAFPARQDSAGSPAVAAVGSVVHPYPHLTMWGDYSNLRRVLDRLDAGTAYSSLPIADQATLHTAACTLGMLAYNLETFRDLQYKDAVGAPSSAITDLSASLVSVGGLAVGATLNQYDIALRALGATGIAAANILQQLKQKEQIERDRRYGFSTAAAALQIGAGTVPQPFRTQFVYPVTYIPVSTPLIYGGIRYHNAGTTRTVSGLARRPIVYRMGSAIADNNSTNLITSTTTDLAGAAYPPRLDGCNRDFPTSPDTTPASRCQNVKYIVLNFDPRINDYFGLNPNATGLTPAQRITREQQFIRLATALSNENIPNTEVKYPALYYLFPKCVHNQLGSNNIVGTPGAGWCNSGTTDIADDYIHNQDDLTSEDYIDEPGGPTTRYITDAAINGGFIYRPLRDMDGDGWEDELEDGTADDAEDGIAAIEITPKTRGTTTWSLPNTTTLTGRVNIIRDGTTNVGVALLDKGIMNGREMMGVRVMDLDLDMLRRSSFSSVERWLPLSGIVYAFREDAVREDAIARPRVTTWDSCDTSAEILSTANCRMDAVGATPKDPPVNDTNGISAKPVDFYADPDRRPHGFRLRNGIDLRRVPEPLPDFTLKGLSFVTDNPAYLMGDSTAFNLHADASSPTTRIEEFTQLLNEGDWSNFYTRNTIDSRFARAGDAWRPAEIVADGISILSQNFRDGSIAEGIRRQNITDPIPNQSASFLNLNAPGTADDATLADRQWVRENCTQSNDVNNAIPIVVNRNGLPLYNVTATCLGTTYGLGDGNSYIGFGDNKTINEPVSGTRMNATIVSGIVASRAQQSFGGFHNFPRFLENWDGDILNLSGAFIQLNFSNYATAPFDQDSWEPTGAASGGGEAIRYYGAPNRRWGYDVGLQYAPSGPVANRFITPGRTRSEFYRELPVNDPYVCLLRKARIGGTSAGIDPTTTDCP